MLVIVEDRENGKWGYVDYNGKTIIEPRFGFAGEFEGPFAYAVGMDDTRGLIDASGEWAVRVHIPRGFHVYYRPLTVDMIANGLIPIESDRSHEMGYVTATGHVRTDVHFSGAQPFSEGLAWVRRSGETHWFCVNTKGERAFPGSFDYALRFREGRAVVGIQDETGKRSRHLDTEGKFVGEQWWDYVEGFSEGLACVRSKEFHGYVDRSGKRAITLPPQTTDAESFSEGLAVVGMKDEKGACREGYIDRSGTVVIPPAFQYAQDFSEGMAYVCEGDEPGHTTKHGFIDKKGRYVCELPPQCTAAGRFRNGLCPVRLKKGKGEEVLYVDRTGRVAVRPPAGYRFEVMFPGEP